MHKKKLFFRKNHRLSPRRRLFLLKPRRMWGSENACSSSLYIAILKFYLLTHMSMSHQSVPKLFEKKDTTSKQSGKKSYTWSHIVFIQNKKNIPNELCTPPRKLPTFARKNFGAADFSSWRVFAFQLHWAHPSSFVALEELNARVQDQSFDADLNTGCWMTGSLWFIIIPAQLGGIILYIPQTTRFLFHCSRKNSFGTRF